MKTSPRRAMALAAAAMLLSTLVACAMGSARPKFPDRPPEEEQLVDVPSSAPAPPPVSASTPAAVSNPALTVLGVSVQPAQVERGRETRLVVSYTVSSLPAGTSVSVGETRALVKDGQQILSLQDQLERVAGTHTSSKPIRVPPEAAPGIYTLEVTLLAGGTTAVGTALFEVR